MTTATLSSKGQVTIPAEVRQRMGLDTGDRIEFVELATGEFAIKPAVDDVRSLKGALRKPAQAVSVDDMNAAMRKRAAARSGR
ncbi:MAG: AbrB/MazE/SpoVT family DNA-binding domain-containing protein [Burkholderiales bacterium]|nr:AbrB/MazE/SpoVT family DNA-binding domain-containing protein [Burkholderiales bacterium]